MTAIQFLPLTNPKIPTLDFQVLSLSKHLEVQAILDSGFEGEVALPKDFYKFSQKENHKELELDLATGSDTFIITTENILFCDQVFKVEVVWLGFGDEPLIGSGFFAKFTEFFSVDYKDNQIRLSLKKLSKSTN